MRLYTKEQAIELVGQELVDQVMAAQWDWTSCSHYELGNVYFSSHAEDDNFKITAYAKFSEDDYESMQKEGEDLDFLDWDNADYKFIIHKF